MCISGVDRPIHVLLHRDSGIPMGPGQSSHAHSVKLPPALLPFNSFRFKPSVEVCMSGKNEDVWLRRCSPLLSIRGTQGRFLHTCLISASLQSSWDTLMSETFLKACFLSCFFYYLAPIPSSYMPILSSSFSAVCLFYSSSCRRPSVDSLTVPHGRDFSVFVAQQHM